MATASSLLQSVTDTGLGLGIQWVTPRPTSSPIDTALQNTRSCSAQQTNSLGAGRSCSIETILPTARQIEVAKMKASLLRSPQFPAASLPLTFPTPISFWTLQRSLSPTGLSQPRTDPSRAARCGTLSLNLSELTEPLRLYLGQNQSFTFLFPRPVSSILSTKSPQPLIPFPLNSSWLHRLPPPILVMQLPFVKLKIAVPQPSTPPVSKQNQLVNVLLLKPSHHTSAAS